MSRYLRYRGEFLDIENTTWRVDIYQEADAAYDSVGDLTFPADEPVLIEYDTTAKEDAVCGSTATIKIESLTDRAYIDLYTVAPCAIVAKIYRADSLYWIGCLDPEFYEEPYETEKGYTVSLTFSDFNNLDRIPFSASAMQTVMSFINSCLGQNGMEDYAGQVDTSLISSSLEEDGTTLTLSDLRIRPDNFYDEDGEADSLLEALEAVLQPLALKIIQRCGVVYVFDLNGLYTNATQKEINWNGDSSTLGVDSVYNNIKITWSTYVQDGNQLPDECYVFTTDADVSAIKSATGIGKYGTYGGVSYLQTIYSYPYSTALLEWLDADSVEDIGFSIWTAKVGTGITIEDSDCRFYELVPQYDGSESEGVAISFYGLGISGTDAYDYVITRNLVGIEPNDLKFGTVGDILFKTEEISIPYVNYPSKQLIRVKINMLMDCRINPFEEAENKGWWIGGGTWKEEDFQDTWDYEGNYVYIPVCLKYQPDGSSTVYVWQNKSVVNYGSNTESIRSLAGTLGSWVAYSESGGNPSTYGYLCWYSSSDRKEEAGVCHGFAYNRPAINAHLDSLYAALENVDDGQYVPYPTYGAGKIWLEVRKGGWLVADAETVYADWETKEANYELFSKLNWILMEMPEIEIVNSSAFNMDLDTDDVEYSAVCNEDAQDDLEIDTKCGTASGTVPTARGAYFITSSGKQLETLYRAGRCAQAEELLIGTLYSQYAERHTTLSGDVEILNHGLCAYTEANQDGKVFILTKDSQDVRECNSEATICELSPDEYDKTE